MKKGIVIGILAGLTLLTGARAEQLYTNFSAESVKQEKPKCPGIGEAYKAGFQAGKKEGYEKGYIAGYKQAVQDFKKIYNQKLEEYKQIEAGKILLKKWYISYPKVVEVPTEDGLKIVIGGCRPLRPFDDLSSKIQIPLVETLPSNFVPKTEVKVQGTPDNLSTFVKGEVKLSFQPILDKMGITYTRKEGSDVLTVYFKDKQEKEAFCSQYRGACIK